MTINAIINFPDQPQDLGTTYTTENGNTYTWDGSKWTVSQNSSQGPVGPSGPSGPSGTFTGTISSPVFISDATPSTSTTTGALVVTGGVGIGGDTYIGGQVVAKSLKIADSVFESNLVIINNTATTVVDRYSANPVTGYRAAKYLIQIDSNADQPDASFEVIEILLLVDNLEVVYATEYGVLTTHGELGDFAADVQTDVNGSTVRLYFTAFDATNKVISILRTGMVA
jgi:hypothetical protein